jgi:hypothetical protein
MTSATSRPPSHHDGEPQTRQGSGRRAFLRRDGDGDTSTGSLSSVTPFGHLCGDGPVGEVERLFLHQNASARPGGNVSPTAHRSCLSEDNDPEQSAARECEPEQPRLGPPRAVHGDAHRGAPQPRPGHLLPAPANHRPSRQGRPGRRHAQAPHDPERHGPRPSPMAHPGSTTKCSTTETVASASCRNSASCGRGRTGGEPTRERSKAATGPAAARPLRVLADQG